MRTKLVVGAALVATGLIGAAIGAAQGAASSPNSTSHVVRGAARPSSAPFSGSAQTMFAVVSADGTLARGYGVAFTSPDQPGQYDILFNRGVAKCAYVATLGSSGRRGGPPVGFVGVVGLVGHKAGVYVQTYNRSGALKPAGFHLVVSCPPLS
jgi:hypothetical protein